MLDPHYAKLVARYLQDRMNFGRYDMVGGPAVGGVLVANAFDVSTKFFYHPYKQELSFGAQCMLGNNPTALVVDDVLNTGQSLHLTISSLLAQGIYVAGVAVVVDRGNSKANFLKATHPFTSLFHATDKGDLISTPIPGFS